MTRKENLLVEIYNLRNQISEIKGNKIVNIEEFSQTREFLDEYDDVKVEAVDATTLRTPAEWNTVCREVILRNYDLMRPHTQLLFHDYFTERYGAKN